MVKLSLFISEKSSDKVAETESTLRQNIAERAKKSFSGVCVCVYTYIYVFFNKPLHYTHFQRQRSLC